MSWPMRRIGRRAPTDCSKFLQTEAGGAAVDRRLSLGEVEALGLRRAGMSVNSGFRGRGETSKTWMKHRNWRNDSATASSVRKCRPAEKDIAD